MQTLVVGQGAVPFPLQVLCPELAAEHKGAQPKRWLGGCRGHGSTAHATDTNQFVDGRAAAPQGDIYGGHGNVAKTCARETQDVAKFHGPLLQLHDLVLLTDLVTEWTNGLVVLLGWFASIHSTG